MQSLSDIFSKYLRLGEENRPSKQDKKERVLVTGGESMVGGAVADLLEIRGYEVDRVPHKECNLLNPNETVKRITRFWPKYVIHAAGFNGGIEFNRLYGDDIYYQTVTMGMNVLNAAYHCSSVERVISLISSCAYPAHNSRAKHFELWNGLPHESVECHGLAKRLIEGYSRQLRRQEFPALSMVINNCYGPRDRFNPERSKVIGGLINKFTKAAEEGVPSVKLWGTGKPEREFVYSYDAASAIINYMLADIDLNKKEDCIVNVSSGQLISIKQLAEMIAEICCYAGNIEWDTDKTDGQLRKSLDISNAQRLGILPTITPLEAGLEITTFWYLENKNQWSK